MRNKIMLAVLAILCLTMPVNTLADDRNQVQTVSSGDPEVAGENNNSDNNNSNGDKDGISDTSYYDAVMEEISRQQEYAIYQNQLNVRLCDLQITYLTELMEEWEEKWKIEKRKQDLGYAASVSTAEVESGYETAKLELETAKTQREFYLEAVHIYGGEYEDFVIPEELETLQGNYVNNFMESSAQIIYYEQQITEYLVSLQLVPKETEQAQILEKQLQLSRMNKSRYEKKLQIYVRELELNYENTKRKIAEVEKRIAVQREKTENASLLYEKGKITNIELTELKTEEKELEYERMTLICNAHSIYYILSNRIEGGQIP